MSGAVVNCTETGEDNLSAKSSGVSPIGLGLYIQRIAGWICLIPLSILIIALLRLRGRHRILRHAEIRRLFKEYTLTQEPLIICANHLTLIDSVIILWALASTYTYVCHYRLFCWNLPAVENTKKRISWRVITYLSKCILIDRLGDAQHTNFRLGQICSLLRNRDLFLLFPEGTRSRDGRINPQSVTYGIGKILQQVPECRVVCVYLRGHGQHTYSDFPRRGEVFDVDLQDIKPVTTKCGLRGARDLSRQVITKLKEMELRYFERHESTL